MTFPSKLLLSTTALGAGLALAPSAGAQNSVPSGLSNQAPATGGVTEVAKEGFQAVAAPPEENKDSTTFKLTAVEGEGGGGCVCVKGGEGYSAMFLLLGAVMVLRRRK